MTERCWTAYADLPATDRFGFLGQLNFSLSIANQDLVKILDAKGFDYTRMPWSRWRTGSLTCLRPSDVGK